MKGVDLRGEVQGGPSRGILGADSGHPGEGRRAEAVLEAAFDEFAVFGGQDEHAEAAAGNGGAAEAGQPSSFLCAQPDHGRIEQVHGLFGRSDVRRGEGERPGAEGDGESRLLGELSRRSRGAAALARSVR